MKKSWLAIVTALTLVFVFALSLCIHALCAPVSVFAQSSGMKVVVDAGHGGIDGGVTGVNTGVKESDLNLQIAFLLKEKLEEVGFEVTLTRKSEEGLYGGLVKGFKRKDMLARKAVIEKAKPNFVLSIHQNRFSSRTTRGAQVFFHEQSEDGMAFASCLQDSLNTLYQAQGVPPRSAMHGAYFMLTCAPVPSVIIECGFLSNAEDEALLNTPQWRNQICESIVQGMFRYFSSTSA